jgi:hypothetical protein
MYSSSMFELFVEIVEIPQSHWYDWVEGGKYRFMAFPSDTFLSRGR